MLELFGLNIPNWFWVRIGRRGGPEGEPWLGLRCQICNDKEVVTDLAAVHVEHYVLNHPDHRPENT